MGNSVDFEVSYICTFQLINIIQQNFTHKKKSPIRDLNKNQTIKIIESVIHSKIIPEFLQVYTLKPDKILLSYLTVSFPSSYIPAYSLHHPKCEVYLQIFHSFYIIYIKSDKSITFVCRKSR